MPPNLANARTVVKVNQPLRQALSEKSMRPEIYNVVGIGSGFIAIMAKPVSGEYIEDEFSAIAKEDINQIVSLLEPAEEYSVGLRREKELTEANGMSFRSFPIQDRGLPDSLVNFASFINEIHNEILFGKNTVVHCRAGIGRAGLVVASVLVRSGFTPDTAFHLVSEKRGVTVPDTEEQRQWVTANRAVIANST